MTLCVAETEQLQWTHQVAFRWEEDRLWKKECDYFTSVQTHKDKINVFPWLWEWEQKIFSSIKPWYLHLVACEDCTFFHGHFASECALSFWIFRKVMQNPNFPSDSVFELQKKCVVSVHTWFSDIRECIADWSQSKHILGLHFKVVPEWRQRKYLMKDSVIECHSAENICDQMKVKRMLMTVADVRGSSAQVDLQKERLIPAPSQRYAQHNKRAIWPGFKGRVESEETFGY